MYVSTLIYLVNILKSEKFNAKKNFNSLMQNVIA